MFLLVSKKKLSQVGRIDWVWKGLNFSPINDDKYSWLERPLDDMEIEEMVFDCEKGQVSGGCLFYFSCFSR